MAAVIQFDRRAIHRVISEPVALDMCNDIDALAQEALAYIEPAHMLALAHGDRDLVRALTIAHGKVKGIREITHEGAALLEESARVDPYRAIEFGGPDAA